MHLCQLSIRVEVREVPLINVKENIITRDFNPLRIFLLKSRTMWELLAFNKMFCFLITLVNEKN